MGTSFGGRKGGGWCFAPWVSWAFLHSGCFSIRRPWRLLVLMLLMQRCLWPQVVCYHKHYTVDLSAPTMHVFLAKETPLCAAHVMWAIFWCFRGSTRLKVLNPTALPGWAPEQQRNSASGGSILVDLVPSGPREHGGLACWLTWGSQGFSQRPQVEEKTEQTTGAAHGDAQKQR